MSIITVAVVQVENGRLRGDRDKHNVSDRKTEGRVGGGMGFLRWIDITRTLLAPASTGMTQNKV